MNLTNRILDVVRPWTVSLKLRSLIVILLLVTLGMVTYGETNLPGHGAMPWLIPIVLYFSIAVFMLRFSAQLGQWLNLEKARRESAVNQEAQRRTTLMNAQRRTIMDFAKYRDRTVEEVVDEFRGQADERINQALAGVQDIAEEIRTEGEARIKDIAGQFEQRLRAVVEAGESSLHDQLQAKFDELLGSGLEELRQSRNELELTRTERATWLEKHYGLSVRLDQLEENLRQEMARERQLVESRLQIERDNAAGLLRAETERTDREIDRHGKLLGEMLRGERDQIRQDAHQQAEANQKVFDKQVADCRLAFQDEIKKERDGRNSALDRRDKKWFQTFRRVLSDDEEADFFRVWNKLLGVDIQRSHIRYLQHEIGQIEDHCVGRLASSVQQAMVNLFVVRAVQGDEVEYLEIGTLFGVQSIITHLVGSHWFKHVHLTIIDPLEGYYGDRKLDPTCGMPVSRATLTHNLKTAGVPARDYQLIAEYSGDHKAIAEAGKKRYDVIYIDGDHSYDGVKADFDNYSGLLKPGGYLVFDDYGDPSWPDVARYVNEHVRTHPGFRHIGDAYNTIVFRAIEPSSKTS